MEITVGDYKIVSDARQFTVYHMTEKTDKAKNRGAEAENLVGYYSTIESAFKALPSRMLMRSDCRTLKEVVDLLEKYRRLIELALKGV